jgi:hypothetical protein
MSMWRHFPTALAAVMSASICSQTPAETYVVYPDGTGDFSTIQEAIDAVANGDIIELSDGVFIGDGNRDIDFLGKAITVRSQIGDPETCTIDCEATEFQPHRGFRFQNAEGSESVLEGVTITNGWGLADDPYGAQNGGGIFCRSGSSPTIVNCVFVMNRAHDPEGYSTGGAIGSTLESCPTVAGCCFLENTADIGGGIGGSFALISGCMFVGNSSSESSGGGARIWGVDALTIENSTFLENSAMWRGGGVALYTEGGSVHVSGCTFASNSADQGGGIVCGSGSLLLENTIVAFSSAGEAVYLNDDATAVLTCCDLYGNAGGDWTEQIAGQYGVDGNISEDPLFCDLGNHDLTLQSTSPCAPENNPECGLIGAWPVGCDGTPVSRATWGRVKAVFRERR